MEVTNLDPHWKKFLEMVNQTEETVQPEVKVAYFTAWGDSVRLYTNQMSRFDKWPQQILLITILQQVSIQLDKYLDICNKTEQPSDNCS